MLFNTTSEVAVGLQLAEFFGTANNHFLQVVNNITNKQDDKKGDAEGGQIGDAGPTSLNAQQLSQQLLGTYLMQNQSKLSKQDQQSSQIPIPVNFYIHRLTTDQTKTYGFCLVFQPIVIIR